MHIRHFGVTKSDKKRSKIAFRVEKHGQNEHLGDQKVTKNDPKVDFFLRRTNHSRYVQHLSSIRIRKM